MSNQEDPNTRNEQPDQETCQHSWYLPDEFYTDTIKCAYCGKTEN